MSSGGGAAGSGGGGRDADMASASMKEMIKSIREITREITGKQHSDEDIYTVLKDCAMDPNETAQKLTYLDTFHEVKKKKDRKKEVLHTQDRGARGSRGNYSANYNYSDGFGVRNAGPRRENGVYDISKRGNSSSSRATQKKNNPEGSSGTKASTVTPNGSSTVTNGASTLGHGQRLHADGVVNVNMESSAANVKRQDAATVPSTPTRPTFDSVVRGGVQGKSMPASNGFHVPSASGVPTTMHSAAPHPVSRPTYGAVVHGAQGKPTSSSNGFPSSNTPPSASAVCSSASDPILAPSNTRHPGAVGTIKSKVGSQRKVDEQHRGNRSVSHDVGSELPNNEKSEAMTVNSIRQKEVPNKPAATEDNSNSPESPQLAALPAHDGALASRLSDNQSPSELVIPSHAIASEDEKARATPQSLPEPTILNGYVTFPSHLLVPDALKSGLTFGSFDASPGLKYNNGNGGEVDATHTVESLQGTDETTRELYASSENGSLTVQVDHSDESNSPHQVHENVPQLEVDVAANADSKADESKETLPLPESHQDPRVQMAPNYGFELMPSLQGGHFVHLENQETPTRDVSHMSSYATEAPAASSSPIPTPSMQNSVAPPQHVMFRPPYHPSYLQYGPYFSPYFFHSMPQFLPNGIPQQSSNGNAYLASSAPPKFPLSQFKHGTIAGNPPPVPSYGSYSSSPAGFNPGSAMTSLNSTGNEDMSASQLKESHHVVYTTGPMSEAFPQQGQDMTSLQLNSMYAQHLAFSPQAGHAAFSGLYSPVQTMAAPSAVNQHLQQSQAMSAANENVGHPPGAYQQPQLPPANWGLNYINK